MLDYIIVIPARYKSSRFPGKPLVDINGTPMIIRVSDIVGEAVGKENVLPVIFEDWAADVPKFVLKLQQFLGIGEMPAEWKSHKTTPKSVWEWQQKLADYDIQKIQNNQACKDYMTQMNYPNGKPDSYAGVKREF